jgi:hypothetical protein
LRETLPHIERMTGMVRIMRMQRHDTVDIENLATEDCLNIFLTKMSPCGGR